MLETIALKLDKQSIRPAFVIGSTTYSYGDLAERVASIQGLIAKHHEPGSGVIAVVDNADFDTYASVLATLMSGCAYLPINPKAPAERNLSILQQTDVALLLTSGEAEGSDLGLWGTDLRR